MANTATEFQVIEREENDIFSVLIPKEDTPSESTTPKGLDLEPIQGDPILDLILGNNTPEEEVKAEEKEESIIDKKEEEPTDKKEKVSKEKAAPKQEIADEDLAYRKEFYKTLSKELIDSGEWKDVEGGIDSLELDDNSFIALNKIQINAKAEELAESHIIELRQTSEIIDGIFRHKEAGGDVDQILDLFKERQSVLGLDWSSEEGKINGIKKYYKEFLGWDESRVKKQIKFLEAEEDGEIDKEVDLVKGKITEHYKKEQDALLAKDQERQRVEAEGKKKKITNSYSILKENGLSDKESSSLLENIFEPKYKNAEGEILTELDARILKIRDNDNELLEFAQFVLNKEQYKKSLVLKTKNETTNSIFQNLKSPAKRASDELVLEKRQEFKPDNSTYSEYKKMGQVGQIKLKQ